MNGYWLRWVLMAVVLGCLTVGCGPSREPGKNKDLDRPKPTEKK